MIVYSSGSDHQQAIECYTKSLDIAKEAGHLAGVKLAHERLQKSYLDLGDTHLFWLVFIQLFVLFLLLLVIVIGPSGVQFRE